MSGVPAFTIKYDKTNVQEFIKKNIDQNSTDTTNSALIDKTEFNAFLQTEARITDDKLIDKIDAVIFKDGETALSFAALATRLTELDKNKDGQLDQDEVLQNTEGVTSSKKESSGSSKSYTIKDGDTLSQIAQDFKKYKALKGKTRAEIMELIKETSPEIFLDKDAPNLDRIAAGKKIDVKKLLEKASGDKEISEAEETDPTNDAEGTKTASKSELTKPQQTMVQDILDRLKTLSEAQKKLLQGLIDGTVLPSEGLDADQKELVKGILSSNRTELDQTAQAFLQGLVPEEAKTLKS